MTIQAQTADGVIHEFPDGTPDAVVDSAIKSYLAQSKPAPAAKPPNKVAQAFTGAINQLTNDARNDYSTTLAEAKAPPPGPLEAVGQTAAGIGRKLKIAGDAGNVVLGPLNEFLFGGASDALAKSPMQAYQAPQLSFQGGPHLTPARPLTQDETAQQLRSDFATAASAALPGPMKAAAPIPAATAIKRGAETVDALAAAKSGAYKAADAAGVRYDPQAFSNAVDAVATKAAQNNLNPMRHPRAASMLADMQALKGQSPTLTDIDQLRQVIRRDVANAPDAAEQHFGRQMIEGLDDFVSNAGPKDVVSGNANDAAQLISSARDANTRYRKYEAVQDAIESAKLQAASTGSGGNVDNAMRQAARRLLKTIPNWTDDERAALTDAATGGAIQNGLRFVGKASPATGGLNSLMSIVATGATHGAAAPPLIGAAAAKLGADAMTAAKFNRVLDLIASGGSKAAARAASSARTSAAVKSAVRAAPRATAAIQPLAATPSAPASPRNDLLAPTGQR
jgi:hypothetical protein